MTIVRNLMKIFVPIIIVAGFFFIMSNFKHTQTLSSAEEKRIKEYASLMQQAKAKEDKTQILSLSSVAALGKGSAGEEVKTVQKSLGLNPDGYFGLETEQAVKEFQVKQGYTADGVVGPQTWDALVNTSKDTVGSTSNSL
ncbi:peptidoglycan-binding protein [Priestia megaterium]|uniref:Putative peptidoglycan binding domain protein n=1 Tax=Priestia megaterium (strain DSM 319 / IMG 1521) TaxID=592022 RepID=D5DBH5_PRIM3|nr:peptidoglycan-binding protein [Priestia megaterium]ADF37957.1 putative peptidoglycan binding domain protein [Priestia megaterium DSM 319]MED4217286.1 peptidoglycan-binding protein [Priestia megaterium]WEZ37205.1 peptidoglycan-binding protein [Priestia megaterium DSM 319]